MWSPSSVAYAAMVITILAATIPRGDALCFMSPSANCTAAAMRAGKVTSGCITSDSTPNGAGCRTDPCNTYTTGTNCVTSGMPCSAVPVSSILCVSSSLLCWSLNQSACGRRKYCSWILGSGTTSYCNYTVPDVAPATAAAMENNCPAINPAVLAILIVMFISLIAAVVVVLVVVVINKKKQDEIDREEEEAEAEAAVGRL